MTTIDDPAPHRPTGMPPRRTRLPLDWALLAWPLGALVLVAVLAAWRMETAAPASGAADAPTAATPVGMRRFDDLRLSVPRAWQTLSRSPDHVTWGTPDRSHTVTVASIEAGAQPLPEVVRASVAETRAQLPGARIAARPRPLPLDGEHAPRGDAAMLVRFEADDAAGSPLQVVQVWRRDSRALQDLIATWTSADGTWPVDPAREIPRTSDPR